MFQNFVHIAAPIISMQALPIIASIVALISFVSLRNQHLSDRCRAVIREYIYDLPTAAWLSADQYDMHQKSLHAQSEVFQTRYRKTAKCVVWLASVFVLAFVAVVFCTSQDSAIQAIGVFAAVIGLAILIYSIWLAAGEFVRGHETLQQQALIMRSNIQRRAPPVD